MRNISCHFVKIFIMHSIPHKNLIVYESAKHQPENPPFFVTDSANMENLLFFRIFLRLASHYATI